MTFYTFRRENICSSKIEDENASLQIMNSVFHYVVSHIPISLHHAPQRKESIISHINHPLEVNETAYRWRAKCRSW